ncbi:hypothetical protein [Halorubrum sp. CGM4_25_10-8A]|uniref:hypothetical protein n=1 Tax=Halorubrum sp. CGM4_25_10-8A TaxID=2518116 RepID=UPI0010F6A7DE|nr:hypothetical protein [Halorubrum sp. CGM4_25_10-8A]TKX40027.1 hypothetical protein EXE52_08805 [Halorubrum sp. CGM4_25_10-8A]
MSDIDAVAGMYNIVNRESRTTADYQLPLDEFIHQLEERTLPKKVCVVGLEEALSEDDDLRERLVSVMRSEMDYLNNQHPLPSIQFAVEGEFQSVGDSFEVQIAGEFYALEPIFGRQIKRRRDGWLATPFRV